MDNIFLELIKRTQNIQAKYCERINSLNKEIEQLLLDMQKIEELHHKKKKHSKEDESKAKKDAEKLKKLLLDIERRCHDSSSSSSSSSSGSSSYSSGSSSNTDSYSSNYSSNSGDTSNCSSSIKKDDSTSSGSRPSSPEEKIKKQKTKISKSKKDSAKSDSEDSYNSDDSQKSDENEKSDTSNSSKDEKTSETSKSDSSESSSDQIQDGFFEFLFNKFNKNPVETGLVQITGNSFDEYESDLLPNIIDSKWDQNHWLSKNIANACIVINFENYLVKVNKYRIRVGCSNGLGRFNSWEIEGTTKDNKKVILDKVLNCADITQDHPEITISIKNDLFIRSVKFMMRGKNTDNNYKMRFRNIEIYGEIKKDK